MPEYRWILDLKVGDVVRAPDGSLRVVRYVQHYSRESICKTTVGFIIRRCSWTRRCYTIYTGGDLATMGYKPTRAKARLAKDFDQRVFDEITHKHGTEHTITCAELRGIA